MHFAENLVSHSLTGDCQSFVALSDVLIHIKRKQFSVGTSKENLLQELVI